MCAEWWLGPSTAWKTARLHNHGAALGLGQAPGHSTDGRGVYSFLEEKTRPYDHTSRPRHAGGVSPILFAAIGRSAAARVRETSQTFTDHDGSLGYYERVQRPSCRLLCTYLCTVQNGFWQGKKMASIGTLRQIMIFLTRHTEFINIKTYTVYYTIHRCIKVGPINHNVQELSNRFPSGLIVHVFEATSLS